MPIVTTRNDDQRCLTVTITDPWSAEDVAAALGRQVADGVWAYATVYDLRGTNWIPTEPDVLWLVKFGQQQIARHGARGPVAVLIDITTHGATLQQYAEYGAEHSHLNLRVFSDEAAAQTWLRTSAAR